MRRGGNIVKHARLAAAGVCACALAGCYTKVIDARGIGSDQIAPKREKPTTTYIEDLGHALEGKKD